MENNFQPQVNNINSQSQPSPQTPASPQTPSSPRVPPSPQVPPVARQQIAPPMYSAPMIISTANKVPGAVGFLMKFVAFFLPVLGFVMGCLLNLTSYSNKSETSKDVLNLSGTMFIVQLVVLTLPMIIAFLLSCIFYL